MASRTRTASAWRRVTTARAMTLPATLPTLSNPTSMRVLVSRLRSLGTGVKSSS